MSWNEQRIIDRVAIDTFTAEDLQAKGPAGAQATAEWNKLKEEFDYGLVMLESTLPLLQLVEKAMLTFESATTATASKIFPLAWEILEEGKKLCSSNSPAARQFAEKFVDVRNERIFCAELLDPTAAFPRKWGKRRGTRIPQKKNSSR